MVSEAKTGYTGNFKIYSQEPLHYDRPVNNTQPPQGANRQSKVSGTKQSPTDPAIQAHCEAVA